MLSATSDQATLRARRDALVDEHIDAENQGDLDRALATFHEHPHYLMLGNELDGAEAVRAGLTMLLTAFENFTFEQYRRYHADDAVVLYGRFTALHRGPYMGIEPTGNQVDVPGVAIFDFDGDKMLNETVFFDNGHVLQQLQGQH